MLTPLPFLQSGFFKAEDRPRYFMDAQDLWSKMLDMNNKYVRLPDDGYLKLMQLRERVDFAASIGAEPFDVILIDEAQVKGVKSF